MLIDFLVNLMTLDSTTGSEDKLGHHIAGSIRPEGAEMEIHEVGNGQFNLYYKWGKPEIIFCTHYDTVPPYIPPKVTETKVYGRGACDAKGQITSLYHTCLELEQEGHTNFGLLLLSGEEVGSYGARKSNEVIKGCKYVIIGEPTENKLITASKGNMRVNCVFHGKSCHSGYPQNGENAIDKMIAFTEALKKLKFPNDEILGETTFNIGMLKSENAHNVVSDKVEMKIFFRTTFATHETIADSLKEITGDKMEINVEYENEPLRFHTIEGFETGTVAFGSDAPDLKKLGKPLMYGPGSILHAHTLDEYIEVDDMYKAIADLKEIYSKLAGK